MKFITLLFLLLNFNCGSAQTPQNWYKTFTGKLGENSGILYLYKADSNYTGHLWLDKTNDPLSFYYSDIFPNTDSIRILLSNDSILVNLMGLITNDEFNGHIVVTPKNGNSQRSSFHLEADKSGRFTAFNYLVEKGNATLPKKLKNESSCDYSLSTIWPKENNTLSIALEKEISILIGSKTALKNPVTWMSAEKDKFISTWQNQNRNLTQKDASAMGMSLSASQQQYIGVMYENNATITLGNFISVYTGGAHNNYNTTLVNLDKRTGKEITLKNILTEEGIKKLPDYLDSAARKQFDIHNQKPLDQNNFFVTKINPSENFLITSNAIFFLYAPYEIKSFADGEIILRIPFPILEKYLLPSFKKIGS